MEKWYVILGIVAFFFGSIYVYANASVYMERIKRKKERKEEERLEALRKEQMLKKQQEIDAKVAKVNRRSEEIQMELKRLEQQKKAKADNSKDNKMKVEQMKKKQVS